MSYTNTLKKGINPAVCISCHTNALVKGMNPAVYISCHTNTLEKGMNPAVCISCHTKALVKGINPAVYISCHTNTLEKGMNPAVCISCHTNTLEKGMNPAVCISYHTNTLEKGMNPAVCISCHTNALVKGMNPAVYISCHTNTLEKGMNPAVLPQLWVNSRAEWFLLSWLGNQFKTRKTINSNQLYSTWKLTLCYILLTVKGLGKYMLSTADRSLMVSVILLHKCCFLLCVCVCVCVCAFCVWISFFSKTHKMGCLKISLFLCSNVACTFCFMTWFFNVVKLWLIRSLKHLPTWNNCQFWVIYPVCHLKLFWPIKLYPGSAYSNWTNLPPLLLWISFSYSFQGP